jgi:hypothetical protein
VEGSESGQSPAGGSVEDPRQRVNRELIELLNELRVVLPGVQVLFAFLLILPFSNGFAKTTDVQRGVYLGTFLSTALSTALLIAPSTYHRIHFRRRDKERMLLTSNHLAVVGTLFLALSIGGVTYLVTDVLYRATAAAAVTAVVVAVFGWFWYGLPLTRERTGEDEPLPSSRDDESN